MKVCNMIAKQKSVAFMVYHLLSCYHHSLINHMIGNSDLQIFIGGTLQIIVIYVKVKTFIAANFWTKFCANVLNSLKVAKNTFFLCHC